MSNDVRIRYETLRTLAFGSVTGSYVGVGAAFAHPVRMMKVTNTTDADLYVSFDGINNMDILPNSSMYIYDYASNNELPVGQLDQSAGERVYVKEVSGAPTIGAVYVTVIYASPS